MSVPSRNMIANDMNPERLDIHNSEVPALCRACEARHGGVCGALSAEQLTELNKHSKRRRVKAGGEIVGQGESMATYSNVLSGVVKLSKMMADGRQQIVGLQFAPDFLGRPFLKESQVSAEAAVDTELCSMPKAVIDRMLNDTPELEHKLHEQALNELDEARDWMLTLGRKTAQEKVASFLYLIASNINPEEGNVCKFDLPLTRADIADFLGLTIETVSRQMTKLRRDGVITIENNRHLTCASLERLRDAADID